MTGRIDVPGTDYDTEDIKHNSKLNILLLNILLKR